MLTIRRLVQLEQTVEKLSKAIQYPSTTAPAYETSEHAEDQSLTQAAPLVVIQDAVRDTNFLHPRKARSLQVTDVHKHSSIISKQIVSYDEARNLLDIFQKHYGRWIAISEGENDTFTVESIDSALLLCSCCLIAVRHSNEQYHKSSTLFAEARSLLGDSVFNASHSIEFFQAIVLLSLWPTSSGGQLLSMDPWLLTGIAFQHATVSNVGGICLDINKPGASVGVRVWNHICLSHLHACVSMRRTPMIGVKELERSRRVAEWNSATNFEVRMVAEIYLYWTIYEHCIATTVKLPRAQAALKSWKDEWNTLLNEPRFQFLHLSFCFAQLLMYEQSLTNKSAAVRESLLSEMVRLSMELLNTAMETIDERTKYLTDHIYHMIAFAAVTLTRLLYKYDSQLEGRHDIRNADTLILSTAQWLQGIELSSHISHMMGSVIKAVHQKLRPAAQTPAVLVPALTQLQAEDLIIPDFLGMDSADFDWDSVIPDWQSLASEDFFSPVNTTFEI